MRVPFVRVCVRVRVCVCNILYTIDEQFDEVENIMWYYEAWNSSRDLSTALFMQQRGMPKIIHWFGANDTALPSQMAAFLIAQGDWDYFSMSREWTDGGELSLQPACSTCSTCLLAVRWPLLPQAATL